MLQQYELGFIFQFNLWRTTGRCPAAESHAGSPNNFLRTLICRSPGIKFFVEPLRFTWNQGALRHHNVICQAPIQNCWSGHFASGRSLAGSAPSARTNWGISPWCQQIRMDLPWSLDWYFVRELLEFFCF